MKNFILNLVLLLIFNNFNGQNYFENCNVKGSTTIYDYNNKKWIYTDSIDAKTPTLPASTFKILNSLIALETKAVKDENEILKWDKTGKKFFGKSMDVWNKDTNLKSAYKNSTIWFYVEMAKKIGRQKYRKYFNEIDYGNKNLTQKSIDFWNYGEFGITPKQQIEFLIKLYEDNLPFKQENIDKVKSIMISESNTSATYRDKTGWTRKDGKDIGWYVGYVENHDNIYFYSTRITENVYPENKNFGKCRISITKELLKKYLKE